MAKKAAPKPIEPKDESQEIPVEEPATLLEPSASSNGKGVTKAQACRAALADGIREFEAAASFARSRFGIEIKATDFALYKSKAKQAQERPGVKAATARLGRKPKAAVEGYLAPPEKPKSPGDPDILLALESIKELIGQFGADKLKRMVDIVG